MRTREDVTKDLRSEGEWDGGDYNPESMKTTLTVELLLDIRDLLQQLQPPTIIFTTEGKPDAN